MLIRVLVVSSIAIVGLFLLPLFWRTRVEMDWGLFTTEWFKACVGFAEVLFAFMIANVLWKNYEKEQEQRSKCKILENLKKEWCASSEELKSAVASVEQTISDGTERQLSLHIHEVSNIRILLNSMCAAIRAESGSVRNGELPILAFKFNAEVTDKVALLVSSFGSGKLLPGKAIDQSDEQALTEIKEFCIDSISKTCRGTGD